MPKIAVSTRLTISIYNFSDILMIWKQGFFLTVQISIAVYYYMIATKSVISDYYDIGTILTYDNNFIVFSL